MLLAACPTQPVLFFLLDAFLSSIFAANNATNGSNVYIDYCGTVVVESVLASEYEDGELFKFGVLPSSLFFSRFSCFKYPETMLYCMFSCTELGAIALGVWFQMRVRSSSIQKSMRVHPWPSYLWRVP